MKRKILILNDIHVGSPSGLLHQNYVDIDGNGTLLNPRQNYLWDNYTKMLEEKIEAMDPFIKYEEWRHGQRDRFQESVDREQIKLWYARTDL